MQSKSQHRWQFSRSGGFDQVRLESAEDLKHLGELDQKLWAALACPVKGLEFDERTLAMIDGDGDGRVRAPEVIAAVKWAAEHLKDVAVIKSGSPTLALAQINDATASGKALLAAAKQILRDLGKADAKELALEEVSDTARIFAQTNFNGDGVVPADAAGEDSTRQLILDAIATTGGVTDRSGKPGIDASKLDAFFSACADFNAWASKPESDASVRPLGDATQAAHDAWKAVAAKVDDYFARCRLAAFDTRAVTAVNRKEEEYLAIAAKDLTISVQEIAGFPLARIEAQKPLPLTDGVNPAWAGALGALRTAAVEPLLGKGKNTLTIDEWSALGAKLAPFGAWSAAKPASAVEKLGLARVREILAGKGKDAVAALIAKDKELEPQVQAIAQVERLVRYQRDLYRLLCNFVNFSDFYDPDELATFQVGTLYLDARSCDLCVRVDDAGKHGALAGFSKSYLAYCDCTRPSGEKMQIAAAFTDGDSDFLMVGRNGVFYDRKGRDWDATITKVIENPISIRQAFWAPYKKLVRMIEELVAKRAAAAEASSDAKLAQAASATANADQTKPAEAPKKVDVGTVAAISVAIAGIGALITTVIGYVAGLFTLPFWQLSLALIGILLLISAPSMLIAWLKLRQRNLGPILDANGWAVNGRVKMNVPFGRSMTSVAKLPPGSTPAPDPFSEKPSPWPGILKVAFVVCFLYSFANSQGWVYAATKPQSWFHQTFHFSLGEAPQAASDGATTDASAPASPTK
ncbi:MAG: hypothetical protein IT454_04905 [Planctomycetes bacterium]|nr:hypothetical protein [Planctomycetota bacterium]